MLMVMLLALTMPTTTTMMTMMMTPMEGVPIEEGRMDDPVGTFSPHGDLPPATIFLSPSILTQIQVQKTNKKTNTKIQRSKSLLCLLVIIMASYQITDHE